MRVARSSTIFFVVAEVIVASGCQPCGLPPPFGYNVFGTILNEDGQPLSDVTMFVRLVDEDGATIFDGFLATSEDGDFEGWIITAIDTCRGYLEFFLPPIRRPDPPLADIVFLEIRDTGQTVSIPVAGEMITSGDFGLSNLDMGVVTLPSNDQE